MRRLLPVLIFHFSLLLVHAQAPENLGEAVNSPHPELNPVIAPDGKTLFFSRVGHPQNTVKSKVSQDVWFCEATESGWGTARRMPAPVNQEEHNVLYSITPDGQTILSHSISREDNLTTIRGFSLIRRQGTGWGAPQRLVIPGLENLSRGYYETACLANDGKTLLMAFSEHRKGRESDLYVSTQNKRGDWSKPARIDALSTKYDETTPFLAADGQTLYFSSNREGGLGSNDIYVAKRLDNSWQKWTKPINVGTPINTPEYDAYYSVSAAGDYAYLVTYQGGQGKADIVRFKLKRDDRPAAVAPPTVAQTTGNPEVPAQPLPPTSTQSGAVVLLSGKLLDAKTRQVPSNARIIYESLPDGTELGTATPDPITGEYKLVLPYGKKYGIRALVDGYMSKSQNLDLSTATGGRYLELTDRDIALVPLEKGQAIALNNIFFDTGKSDLRPESFPELNYLLEILTNRKALVIEIGGHTDNVGGNELNNRLSQARADAVRQYLLGKGLAPERITSLGYGETRPVAPNDTDEGRQQNRRVEFTIVK